MFSFIANKISKVFDRFSGNVTEKSFAEFKANLKEVLIDCDASLSAIEALLSQITNHWKSSQCSDLQQVVREEITTFLSGEQICIPESKTVIMLVGAKGSGKTTSAAKLAFYFQQQQGKKVLLVSTDTLRPAGALQLKILADSAGLKVFTSQSKDPCRIWQDALEHSKAQPLDLIVCDTAGCMHSEEIEELGRLKHFINPNQTLLVADALGGQSSIKMAKSFAQLNISSVFLSKIDGDAQGAVALSIKHELGKPITFLGTGEKLQDVERFSAEKFANRILDLGDIETLTDKVESIVSKEARQAELEKLSSGSFDFDDYARQISRVTKLGGLGQLISFLPGASKILANTKASDGSMDKLLNRQLAIINSMTKKERRTPALISNYSRKRRLAKGSGSSVRDVEGLLEQFNKLSSIMKLSSPMEAARKLFGAKE